ncbi:MAG: hypothetical protein AMXMBFR33_32400 [Candidatus Xenobia bacterium]
MKLRITIENRVYEVEVEASEPEPTPPPGFFGLPATPAAPPPPSAPSGSSEKVARSPVAGVVVKVLVEVGQKVESGQPVLVLEAMKMETNVAAAAAGVLKAVLVKPGEAVQGGQALFELE